MVADILRVTTHNKALQADVQLCALSARSLSLPFSRIKRPKLAAAERGVKCSGDYIIEDLFRNWVSSELFDEQSFISKLHESHIWDDDEYWKLDNAIYDLAIKYGDDDCLPREIAWPIARIFSYLMMAFEAHHNKNDFFAIKDLDSEQVFNRRERVQLVFEGFFKGEMIPNDSFDYFDPSR